MSLENKKFNPQDSHEEIRDSFESLQKINKGKEKKDKQSVEKRKEGAEIILKDCEKIKSKIDRLSQYYDKKEDEGSLIEINKLKEALESVEKLALELKVKGSGKFTMIEKGLKKIDSQIKQIDFKKVEKI
ncbi:MAG: hypothetical protein Q7J14_01040, partial [Candidatus Magasanikbacteria bacterium]|nr:hypothetical protein [Candidatus Magasanikbacteria bacterium]